MGEGPGQQGEGGADRIEFIGGRAVILVHVGDQAGGGVEVETGFAHSHGHGQQRAGQHRIGQCQQHHQCRQQPGHPGHGRAAADHVQGQPEYQQAESAEQPTAERSFFHPGVEQDAEQLHAEQSCRRVLPDIGDGRHVDPQRVGSG
ncbi:hypothetical protein D3C80_1378500 [compost metagenome]